MLVLALTGACSRPESPCPLTARGLCNLIAFAQLQGYVHYFHPSDEAAGADWEAFTIAGVRAVEHAGTDADLAAKLGEVFRPVGPTIRVSATGALPTNPQDLLEAGNLASSKVVSWRHRGFGTRNRQEMLALTDPYSELSLTIPRSREFISRSPFHSERIYRSASGHSAPLAMFRADLGSGLAAMMPLELVADNKGTLPHINTKPCFISRLLDPRPSADDRATRLAAVILAWNVFQHFYPYFDVIKANWDEALERALRSAAIDVDEFAFCNTMRRLVAVAQDGHGWIFRSRPPRSGSLPLLWDWVEDKLIITGVRDARDGRVAKGDAVLEIDGKPAAEKIAEAEALISGATVGWIRFNAVRRELLTGKWGDTVRLLIEPYLRPGERRTMDVRFDAIPGSISEARPPRITEFDNGTLYVDLCAFANDAEWTAELGRMAKARGVVFDMRCHPLRASLLPLPAYLSHETLAGPRFSIPIVTHPDRQQWRWDDSGQWRLRPKAPFIPGKRAFLVDGRSISHAEVCLAIVERYRLATIIGESTAGTNGNAQWFSVPGGFVGQLTGMRTLRYDGTRHHGVGIRPDIAVSRTRAGVAEGKDEMLEAALRAVAR